MDNGVVGKLFKKGQKIIQQGETGQSMYVIQSGKVEVIKELNEREILLSVLGDGDFFGELALFQKDIRSETVRAVEDTRILTIDKKNFIKRVTEDPTLAFHLAKVLSRRLHEINAKHSRVRASDRRNWDERPDKYHKQVNT